MIELVKGGDKKLNERLKQLRKECKLSQEEFGKRIGITKSSVSKLETGENSPSEQTIILICREFNVNEVWLRAGSGEMFIEMSEEEEIADLVYGLLDPKEDDFYLAVLELVHTYKELSPGSQQVIREMTAKFMDNYKKRRGD